MAAINPKTPIVSILNGINSRIAKRRRNGHLSAYSLIAFPSKTDSPRSIMNAHASGQCVNLLHSQKPYINTNFEDVLGNASVYRVVAEHDFAVRRIIKKFDQLDTDVQPYLMFIEYLDSGIIDVIERTDVQNLSEKYGFQNINTFIDSLKEGDVVPKGTVLFHPTSYDEFGNYGSGRNVLFMYMSDAYTMEDSISVTRSFAKNFTSMEVESVTVTLNENNALANIYGDEEHYQTWPNVGEDIKKKLLCSRRIMNRQEMYYSFKSSNLRKPLSTDKQFTCDGTVVDFDIFCNTPRSEIRKAEYNDQFLFYLDMSDRYNTEVYSYTSELRKTHTCTQRVAELNHRAGELIDPNTRIKDEAREFSLAKIRFTIKRESDVNRGQKSTGRFGNKGVISRIVEDCYGFHLRTGEVIQMLINPLGVANRLNIMQLFEQSITFRGRRILEKMRETPSLREKEKLLFPFIRIFNEKQADAVERGYRNLPTTKDRKAFMDDTEKYGIFITVNPFWHDKELFECVMECEEKFPWIEPYEVFFWNETSHRWVRQMNRQPVGYMYMIKMKQTSKRGMSARATGPVNQRGVPDKSHDARDHVAVISNGAVRLGNQEYNNYAISVPPQIIAAESMMYRSSPVARRMLGKMQEQSSLGIVDEFEFNDTMTNRNVETLNCKLLSMGLEMGFEQDELDFSDTEGVKQHVYKNARYLCTTNEMRKIVAKDIVNDEINNGNICVIGTNLDKNAFIDRVAYEIASSVEYMVCA